LKAEVAELLARAEAADRTDIPDELSIPEELARREERLAKLAAARAKIESRAKGGEDGGHRQKAWRQAAPATGRGSTAHGSDQSDR
jgi:hypothetical protein